MQLAAKIISPALRNFGIFPHNENMPTVSHQNAFYFLRCVHVRYVQCLFTYIQKQQNMLKVAYFLRIRNFHAIAKLPRYCFYMNTNIVIFEKLTITQRM